jgi:hypothetical protein
MSELVSVTQQQFSDFIFYIRQRTRIKVQSQSQANGNFVVRYQVRDGVVVGEITFSRQFATTWKVFRDGG